MAERKAENELPEEEIKEDTSRSEKGPDIFQNPNILIIDDFSFNEEEFIKNKKDRFL